MKKLANSRISNVTKSFEEKLLQKDKAVEELQLGKQADMDQIILLNARIKDLEGKIISLGGCNLHDQAIRIRRRKQANCLVYLHR